MSYKQRKVTDPKTAVFIKFFNSQGFKFVDHETKEELVPGDEDNAGAEE